METSNILKELTKLDEMLTTNQSVDWMENDPTSEFETLSSVVKGIITKVSDSIPSERDKAITALGQYISEDDISEAYDKLLAQDDIDGTVSADDIIQMWQPMEDRYTVSQLLNEL